VSGGGEKMSGESERRQFRTVDGRHTATTTPASHRVRYDISRECRRTAAESTDKLSLAGGEARRGAGSGAAAHRSVVMEMSGAATCV